MEIASPKEWRAPPEEEQKILLTSTFYLECGMTGFAPGYSIRNK